MSKGEDFSEFVRRKLEPSYSSQESAVVERVKSVIDSSSSSRSSPSGSSFSSSEERLHPNRERFESVSGVFVLFLLLLMVFLVVSTDTSPFLVLVSLLPVLLTVILSLILYEAHLDNRTVLWVLPLVLSFLFHWFATGGSSVVAGVDAGTLTALNVVLGFLYIGFVSFFLSLPPAESWDDVSSDASSSSSSLQPSELSSFIASIEDKSKALNFVIGRVYNAYHGGSKDLRDRVRLKKEWYDYFSSLPSDPSKVDKAELLSVINNIESHLRLLEKSEAEIFGPDHRSFRNLVRSPDGSDRVIDVLDKNDKDPVLSYYEGALQFCGKVKELLSQDKVLVVKNSYVSSSSSSPSFFARFFGKK